MSKRPSSFAQVRQYLSVAKRAGNDDFDAVWKDAIKRTKFTPHATEDRTAERVALEETRQAWEAAYHGEDVRGGAGLVMLGEFIGDRDETAHVPPPRTPPQTFTRAPVKPEPDFDFKNPRRRAA